MIRDLAQVGLRGRTITPGTVNITIPAGMLDAILTILGDPNLITDNIKSTKSIFGISGKTSVVDTSDANAIASQLLAGLYMYVNGLKITGTMPDKRGLQVSGTQVNVGVQSYVYISPPTGYVDNTTQVYLSDPNFIPSNIIGTVFGLVGTAIPMSVSAGDVVLVADNTIRTTTLPSDTIVGSKYTTNYNGSIRVKFSLKNGTGSVTSYGKIYKNGVAITSDSTSSTSYITYSHDLTCVSGDYFQLSISGGGSTTTYTNYFAICCAVTQITQS